MRRVLLTTIFLLMLGSTGCFETVTEHIPLIGSGNPTYVHKLFLKGTVDFIVDIDALPIMSKLMSLRSQVQSVAEPSDKQLVVWYMNVDRNRDQHITKKEAESFYRMYVIMAEDTLSAEQEENPAPVKP